VADEAGSNLRDWQHPWLRVNVLLRDMAHVLRDPGARSVIKIEVNNAIKMREKLRRYPCWN